MIDNDIQKLIDLYSGHSASVEATTEILSRLTILSLQELSQLATAIYSNDRTRIDAMVSKLIDNHAIQRNGAK